MLTAIIIFVVIAAAIAIGLISLFLRVVVSTNDVHIVQSAKSTTSYGKDQPAGNVYYKWPSALPLIGINVISLPVSVFAQNLNDYAAYDKGRVPFMIDIIAFFRITDSNVAAQRVSSMQDLTHQLEYILKGAIRSILASSEIEEILEGRSHFGEMFTRAVDEQLIQWGVQTVKSIELMDIRDTQGSKVIDNIMAKNKSKIEMESRVAVAENMRVAETAEVVAQRAVAVQQQEAEEQVGVRAAQREQQVGISGQLAQQAIKEQEKETAVKTMAVLEVQNVRQAEITQKAQIITAEQAKQVAVISAEAEKQRTILVADGALEAAKRNAEAVTVQGVAKGSAEKAFLMAPVEAQIALAQEIGQNEAYQTYLISVKQIEAGQVVGIEQAQALKAAQIKVIANAGTPIEGVKTVMELLTSKGGVQLGSALEALKQSDAGAALLNAIKPNGGGN
jgi:flotillin